MVLLVRFGEIALKSRYVRRQMRDRLVANIQDMFASDGAECITEADEARIYVHADDVERARGILSRVFGIVSVSPATEGHADIETLNGLAIEEAARSLAPGRSFAIRARRVGNHPFTSTDLAREAGAAVLRLVPGARVDLTHPDVEIHIEVRNNRGFVFREVWSGPGGLPLGSQGRGLALIEDEAGMVAAWLGMKRGCRVVVAAHDSAQVEPLRRWDPHLKVLGAEPMDRLGDLVRLARADAVFVGTRAEAFRIEGRPRLQVPMFEPVVGLAGEEIAALAAKIRGT
jgi:thiamine biosynthesis protein ThiI